MSRLKRLTARQVLDSRGNPTIEVCAYSSRNSASAIVPSGASTGMYEAVELRDGKAAYGGKGVLQAVQNVIWLGKRLQGRDFVNSDIDGLLISLDGSENKSRLGANAMLGVSMAIARLAAVENGLQLFEHLAMQAKSRPRMPVPFANIINGGKHAGTELKMQEFMLAAVNAKTYSKAVQATCETYHALKEIIGSKYGRQSTNVGDEGGFALPIAKAEDALRLMDKAIEECGYEKIVKKAVDCAASEYYNKNGLYLLHRQYTAEQLSDYYDSLIRRYGILSIEDPFEQNDFAAFAAFTVKSEIQVVGDDLLVTNPARIKLAAEKKLCNALLLKVNQIGTLKEALEAARLAKKNRWRVMVSHRSGETEDAFIADLAVALGCGQIKLGAPCRGERTAKYNQLLRIEEQLGRKANYGF